jgi:hypothetical protein
MKNAYRRVEAVFDDVARVYRDSAQAAKDGKDPELLSSALCVQLCFEVMEDVRSRRPFTPSTRLVSIRRGRCRTQAATSVGAGAEWKPKTRELANQAAALRPQPWQSHVRRTQSMKTNTGVMIRENVKLGVKASIARDKSRPLQNACIASELHLALAIYVGNAAGPCKETAGRVLDLYGDWHLGADRKEASDVVQMVPVKGGKIQGSLVAADEEEVQERRLLVGRKFKRPGLALDIGTVQDYDRDAKKYRASYADGGEELISIADVTSGLLAFLPAVNMAALDAAAAARAVAADEAMADAPAAAESTKELNEEGARVTTVATSPHATAAPPAEPSQPVELPDQRAVLFPELVGAPAPAAAPMDTAPDAPPATPDAVPAATDAVADAGAAGASEAPPAAPDEVSADAPASPRSGKPAEALAESGRRPTDASPAKTRGATAEPEPEPPAPPKVREHDAHVTIRCGGTKLWCARDARDLLKALAAFNKGAPKEKKTKLKAVRKSRRRS